MTVGQIAQIVILVGFIVLYAALECYADSVREKVVVVIARSMAVIGLTLTLIEIVFGKAVLG